MPPGPDPADADPFDHIFNDYLGGVEPGIEQLITMHALLREMVRATHLQRNDILVDTCNIEVASQAFDASRDLNLMHLHFC